MLPSFSSDEFKYNENPQKIQLNQIKTSKLRLNNLKFKKSENKFNSSNSVIQSKSIKQQSKQSFQQQFYQISDFDNYIDKQFDKMSQQKSQNPTLMIPKGFQTFIHSKLFQNLLKKIYQYMFLLISSQKKFKHIQQISEPYQIKNRYEPSLKKMRYQSYQLQQKCKQIGYIYMGILLSYGESKMIFKDQYFFETMIYFIAQILKTVFQQEQISLIEEELNRIFRTNTFNLIKRRNQEDIIYKKYPALKQIKYQTSKFGIERIIKRINIQKKFKYSLQIKPDKVQKIKKPIQIQLSSFGSVQSRSPLISSFYPSSKQKLYEFGKSARQRESFIKQNQRSFSVFYTNKNKKPII